MVCIIEFNHDIGAVNLFFDRNVFWEIGDVEGVIKMMVEIPLLYECIIVHYFIYFYLFIKRKF